MACTTHSPRKVIAVALEVGRQSLGDYAHRYAPHKFTQPQLFACIVLMVFEGWDYRTTEEHLRELPQLGQWIGLASVPDHSTLHKAAGRLFGVGLTQRMLSVCVRMVMGKRRIIARAAADGTGLESGHRSSYFVRRCARGQKGVKNPLYQTTSYTRYPKLTLLIDCRMHLILATHTARGPKPDMDDLVPLLGRLPEGVTLSKLLADAGFDSEANHRFVREEHGIELIVPAKHGRPRKDGGPPSGPYRRRMHQQLRTYEQRKRRGYNQRPQVETVNSMFKRNLTAELTSKSHRAQSREMRRLAIVHNIMV